ncbi:MAG TPA: hypothetical protein DCS01_08335, partial [Idiomarina abyssalis]|nr:hypothetical protein [Idiomarina abyssalis]
MRNQKGFTLIELIIV